MKAFKITTCFILLLLFSVPAYAQPDSTKTKKRVKVYGVPLLFYTPETRFGFGASGICLFNFKKDSLRSARSSVNLGFTYTQNRQVLFFLPYNLFLNNRSYHVYGEFAYNRYFYNFYGVGNDNPPDFYERYGIEFPRMRLTLLKRIAKGFYIGPRYAYDRYSLFDLDTNGLLYRGNIVGSGGGTISGAGLVTLIDTRDDIFYPSKGMWAELVLYRNDKIMGGTINYSRIAFDFSTYFKIRRHTILAFNAYTIYSNTNLPFFQMASMGGLKKMRGFYEGRYRDNNLLVFQAEYRRHLFWMLGFTLFADVGQVAHRYNSFNKRDWRYTYGAGLRLKLDNNQKINLRIDVAVGNKKLLPYFTIGEAF